MPASSMTAQATGCFAGVETHPSDTPAAGRIGAAVDLTTSLRRTVRALAGDAAQRNDRDAIAEVTRPILAAFRDELRDCRRHGASGQAMSVLWSRMADAAVLEAYRMARFQSGQASILAPLTVVAIGAYGAGELRPERSVQLLLLVPSGRCELAGRRMARHLTQNLRAMGLAVSATVTTARGGAGFQHAELPADGRLLAGSRTLWATVAVPH